MKKYKNLVSNDYIATRNKSYEQLEDLVRFFYTAQFWKTIKMSSPLYGSDSPGTLMDKNIPWNLSDLYSLLKDGLNYQKWDGITHPYLYFGCWKSMFGFHKEDMDLCSINYHHFGEPKHWYAIAGRDKEKFETLVKKLYPSQYKACKEFIRHKTILLHPDVL